MNPQHLPELGNIILSRRILSELSAETIQQLLDHHQRGEVFLSDGRMIKGFDLHDFHHALARYYNTEQGRVKVVTTSLRERVTYVFFLDEEPCEYRGYFNWETHLKHRSPFTLGRIVATEAISQILGMPIIHRLIEKQLGYDWGHTCEEDWRQNDVAIELGNRVVSLHIINGEHVFVITEADRSVTTILFAYEY